MKSGSCYTNAIFGDESLIEKVKIKSVDFMESTGLITALKVPCEDGSGEQTDGDLLEKYWTKW